MNDTLWSGRSLTVDQVLDRARVTHGDVFLELGNGNQRTFNTLTGRDALRDDLVIY